MRCRRNTSREAALRVWQQPGVTMLIHFLVRDEPSLGGWQSGLFSVGGAAKLAYHAFALPLARGVAQRLEHGALGAGAPRLRRAQLRAAALGRRPLARRRLDGEDVAERRLHAARDPAAPARRFASSRPRSAGPSPPLRIS